MEPDKIPAGSKQRLISVDALRGFDMLWIIGGSKVAVTLAKASGLEFLANTGIHFDHTWGEFRFYDLIMPLFLFIVGVVMPVSFNKRLERGSSKKDLYHHVLKRVLVLYILGLITSGHILTWDISKIHLWTNTLHSIAVGYLVSAVLLLELRMKWQIIVTASLLILYWLILALVPVPGHGAGIYREDVNLALYIDDAVLGHFQEGSGWTYILSNMTFTASVMLGVFAGKILLSGYDPLKKAGLLALTGLGCIIAGKIWGIWFPIIHHIWTSSLVLYAGGWSFLLMSVFYLLIDVWGFRRWAFPFTVIGMNAIAIYVATRLFSFSQIGNIFVGGLAKYLDNWYPFVQALAALMVIWLILYWFHKKKIYIKI